MLYFDCFVVGAWTFAFGWFLGAVYVQNQNEKTERPRVSEKPERCPECEAWRLPVAASASAAD
jgi:hypothetical protein